MYVGIVRYIADVGMLMLLVMLSFTVIAASIDIDVAIQMLVVLLFLISNVMSCSCVVNCVRQLCVLLPAVMMFVLLTIDAGVGNNCGVVVVAAVY